MLIKKILCPVDFSKASENATEYAARLAQKTGATISLKHVLPVPEVGIADTSMYVLESFNVKRNDIAEQLERYSTAIKQEFKVECAYDVDPFYISGISKEAVSGSGQFDLVVAGTNGADNIYQFYFGTNSYHMAKSSGCPVLIVPEECEYKDIQCIVFASDYNKDDEFHLQQLKDFAGNFNPRLHVLHVSHKDSAVGTELYHSFCNLTDEALNYENTIEFQRIITEDAETATAIEDYMHKSKADILAISLQPHGFLYRLVHKNLVKRLTSCPDYPLLVFHK